MPDVADGSEQHPVYPSRLTPPNLPQTEALQSALSAWCDQWAQISKEVARITQRIGESLKPTFQMLVELEKAELRQAIKRYEVRRRNGA